MSISPTDNEQSRGNGLLHVRLLTPLDSSSHSVSQPVKAVIFRPYYTANGTLLFSVGTLLGGEVSRAFPSGKMEEARNSQVRVPLFPLLAANPRP